MRRKAFGRDFGLTSRMFFTIFLLGALYVFFFALLLQSGASYGVMIVLLGAFAFIQYFTSDKIALASSGNVDDVLGNAVPHQAKADETDFLAGSGGAHVVSSLSFVMMGPRGGRLSRRFPRIAGGGRLRNTILSDNTHNSQALWRAK